MKIHHIDFYDQFGSHHFPFVPQEIMNRDYHSLHELAMICRKLIQTSNGYFYSVLCFCDNWRYLYVTEKSFDVHYHSTFVD